ncbi:uncharacterized protein KY384_002698 [Bacidia gigantensis]|uniref:uncharacterized protein n=1 Tax=Bacidia gigantensis TaxID=2732470 RepID=UPI001D059F8E|nr:uncharacterized protein KY384_002698 [Bacidia gigantensis]KAG8532820.1 hypothetical protein KY384_002698 [Bacidia gigantensis]
MVEKMSWMSEKKVWKTERIVLKRARKMSAMEEMREEILMRPPVATQRRSHAPATLPPYEHPTHALNKESQRELHNLPNNHKLQPLKERLKKANELLTEAAGEINDRLHAKVEQHEKAQKKREQQSSQASGDFSDEALENMRENTVKMTKILEENVRAVIDSKAGVEHIERVLQELDTNATANRGMLAPTQSTLGASQFRGPKRRRINDEEEDEDDAAATPIAIVSAVETLKHKIAEHGGYYEDKSMSDRYASHNDYIGFKQVVHDSQYPGDTAPPLPHASTWFGSQGPGTQMSSGPAGIQANDPNEDFMVESERVTMKCPITLTIMKDPVKSKKCVHNFERDAILEMIQMIGREPRERGAPRKVARCPVCEVPLTADDLEPNQVLLRKIKRIQAAEQRRHEESDDENDVRRPPTQQPEVTSSPAHPTKQAVKRERMSQATRRDASMVPSTQINQIE